ncbi:MAG: hypothetical protein ACRD2W_04965 [Acidimicrobiales bacterium]
MTGTLGLLVTGSALTLLVVRQVLGAAWVGRDDVRGRLRAFDLVLILLLVAFAAVVVVRFDRLSV